MSNLVPDEEQFDALFSHADAEKGGEPRASSRLKSGIYSALVRRQEESGPLATLVESRQAGRGLCVFEQLVRIAPVGLKAKTFNCCRVCHARVLAESIENAPIYWGQCPYVAFQKR